MGGKRTYGKAVNRSDLTAFAEVAFQERTAAQNANSAKEAERGAEERKQERAADAARDTRALERKLNLLKQRQATRAETDIGSQAYKRRKMEEDLQGSKDMIKQLNSRIAELEAANSGSDDYQN